ncbi:MAG: alanine--tRNA ligase-related protein [Candidatus Hodgkinia cicadicola]|nr:MAG: alanine--tRNA ligase-related protein [Candidatus Hodgkinia cicadicola]
MVSSVGLKRFFVDHCVSWGHLPIAPFPVKSTRAGLLFNNSGMAPLYNMFCSATSAPSPLCSVQGCVRLGGKHNDYYNIGTSQRHLSFFEMMGSFAFGNYGKLYALLSVWEFLLKLGFNANQLVITVHSTDLDTLALWKRVAGASCNVVTTYGEQNVWKVGTTGLCGLCTEVYYVNGSDYWEVLNVVFVSHEQNVSGCKKLETSCVDVGIGLERVLAVLDGSFDVYLTDVFKRVADAIWKKQPLTPFRRVLLDHVKCSSFVIADGVVPSSTGAGYVLRKLIRRSVTEALVARCEVEVLYLLAERFTEANGFGLDRSRKVLDVFRSEVELYLKLVNSSIGSLSRRNASPCFYSTYGISKRLLQALAPKLFKSRLEFKPPLVYRNKSCVRAVVLNCSNGVLVLNKTSLVAGACNQVGDQGVVVASGFGSIANHETIGGGSVHKLLFTGSSAGCASSDVFVIRNEFLSKLVSRFHSSYQVFARLLAKTVGPLLVLNSKVSYTGFNMEFERKRVLDVLPFIDHFLNQSFVPFSIGRWYFKADVGVVRVVEVGLGASSLKFCEDCQSSRIEACEVGPLWYGIKQLSENRLRVSARGSRTSNKESASLGASKSGLKSASNLLADYKLSYSLAGVRFCFVFVYNNSLNNVQAINPNTFGVSAHICLKLGLIRCWFSAKYFGLKTVLQKLPLLDAGANWTMARFVPAPDVVCGLLFVKSVCFLLEY